MSKQKENTRSVKPVELAIECDEVVKRYPISEAIEIVRCKTAIFLHSTCFWVVSKPTLANNMKGGAFFEMLSWYCDYMDERGDYTEEDKQKFDTIGAMIVNILTLPLDVFTDMDFMLDIANYILDKRTEYYQRLFDEASKEKPETLEDAFENAQFEAQVLAEEAIKNELSELAKKNADVANKRTS